MSIISSVNIHGKSLRPRRSSTQNTNSPFGRASSLSVTGLLPSVGVGRQCSSHHSMSLMLLLRVAARIPGVVLACMHACMRRRLMQYELGAQHAESTGPQLLHDPMRICCKGGNLNIWGRTAHGTAWRCGSIWHCWGPGVKVLVLAVAASWHCWGPGVKVCGRTPLL